MFVLRIWAVSAVLLGSHAYPMQDDIIGDTQKTGLTNEAQPVYRIAAAKNQVNDDVSRRKRDLTQSLDDILYAPYNGPIPQSLDPLMGNLLRPARNSLRANNRFIQRQQPLRFNLGTPPNIRPESRVEPVVTGNPSGVNVRSANFNEEFDDPQFFFDSARIQRRSDDFTEKYAVSSSIDDILNVPFDGVIPLSLDPLINRNFRRARKIQNENASSDKTRQQSSSTFNFRLGKTFSSSEEVTPVNRDGNVSPIRSSIVEPDVILAPQLIPLKSQRISIPLHDLEKAGNIKQEKSSFKVIHERSKRDVKSNDEVQILAPFAFRISPRNVVISSRNESPAQKIKSKADNKKTRAQKRQGASFPFFRFASLRRRPPKTRFIRNSQNFRTGPNSDRLPRSRFSPKVVPNHFGSINQLPLNDHVDIESDDNNNYEFPDDSVEIKESYPLFPPLSDQTHFRNGFVNLNSDKTAIRQPNTQPNTANEIRFRPRGKQSRRPGNPQFLPPAFVPGPSPPARILPPISIRSPKREFFENQRLPRETRQQDIFLHRTLNVEESAPKEDRVMADQTPAQQRDEGFTDGFADFPTFTNIGGNTALDSPSFQGSDTKFEPIKLDFAHGAYVPNFEKFEIPHKADLSDISFEYPKFDRNAFTAQKSLYRGDLKELSPPPRGRTSNSTTRRRRSTDDDEDYFLERSSRKRIPTYDGNPESNTPHKRVPRQFGTEFPFLKFQDDLSDQNARSNLNLKASTTPQFASRDEGVSVGRAIKIVDTSDGDHLIADSQRFYPAFNPRIPPRPRINSRGSRSYFPSSHGPSRHSGPRGTNSFNSHTLNGFRDFHETFPNSRPLGPGAREAINRPNFAFPINNNNDYPPLDNTLLGSGNFEVLSGGTFYDKNDLHLNHHPYDHYLDNSYVVFPAGHNGPHTNNHVDDFFSNFRDFSEFAVRRSGSGDGYYADDVFGHGYGTEHKPVSIRPLINLEEPNSTSDDKTEHIKSSSQQKKRDHIEETVNKTKKTVSEKPKRPRNIQEVIEEPISSSRLSSIMEMEEKDPLIAIF